MASTYLSRTPNNNYYLKATFSFWFKRNSLGEMGLFGRKGSNSTANLSTCHFGSTDDLLINFRDSGGNSKYYQITNRKFKDTNAWYHFHYIVDGDNSTQGDRSRLYINGVRETSFALNNNPSSNSYEIATFLSSDGAFTVGRALRSQTNTFGNFDGLISNFNCSTGYVYEPTVFGEVDTTTGQWKIINNPTFTPGTDGFTILKDGNTITDQSANSNNFSLTAGTLTDTKDCPDNVFATMNVLDKNTNVVLTNGSNSLSTTNNGNWVNASRATLGIGSAKVYWEMKITGSGNSNGYFFGICADTVSLNTTSGLQDTSAERAKGMLLFCDDGQYQLDNNSRQSMTTGAALNDVLACAVDRSSNNVKFYKNGAQVGSIDISSSPLATVSDIMPLTIGYYTALQLNHNFGNGVFGTSTISSSGTSASTPGTFEHDVPSGYQPLSTKGLNA